MLHKWSTLLFFVFVTLVLALLGTQRSASAAQLTLTWTDNSSNEDGFGIERRIGSTGTYQALTTVGPNVTSYTDLNLLDGTTYCYHVFAFDSAGPSAYSPEACATTPATTPPPPANTISTNIANGAILSGSSVTWTATPTGSPVRVEFLIDGTLSWTESSAPYQYNGDPSGTLDTTKLANGSHQLTVNAVYSDASTALQTVTVTVSNTSIQTFILTVAKTGSGSGAVTSSPTGINCGSTCSANFTSGALVTLTATPASGSTFAGWSGTGCAGGSVTMSANTTCTATFNLQTFSLTVGKTGSGSGTVTSSPTGINCGSTCSANFTSGTLVTLTATPASGSTFAGWSGTGCAGGSVTMSANTTCTATFNVAGYTLTTTVVDQVTSSGSASGSIVSSPAGINCGTDCTETYVSGTIVKLTPVAGTNSKFSGWTGDSDCSDGSVTMNANKTCTANFALNSVTLSVSKNGNGTVTSTPAGISCGTVCSYSFPATTSVTLRATPAPGFIFSGWSGGCTGTSDCTVTLTSATAVTANFFNGLIDKIGVYRPSTGEWFLDRNGNLSWDGCGVDLCLQPFAGTNGVPVVGDWNGSGATKVGLFVPASAQWLLDMNGNGAWDGCTADTCIKSFGQSTDVPVVGQWTTASRDGIGIFRPGEKKWHLDSNGNDVLDRCTSDKCPALSVYQNGDIPVAGDWTGRGTTQVGLFRPSTGQWFLDRNANGDWDGCRKDICISSFGRPGDIPVTGDWNGTGISKIGIFRPSTGEWFLDMNGNGKWDGPQLDEYVPAYGQLGDIPVVGKW